MPKTPLRAPLLRRLAEINDQCIYFTFVDEQFSSVVRQLSVEARERFTPDVFPDNPHADRINVQVKWLPAIQDATQRVGLGAFYAAGYQVVESYAWEALELIDRVNGAVVPSHDGDIIEDVLARYFRGESADEALLLTFEYLRLRRNHFIHLREGLTARAAQLIRYRGPDLNNAWPNRGQLDFASPDLTRFDPPVTRHLFATLRALAIRTDETLASHFQEARIVALVAAEVRQANPTIGDDIPRLARKIAARAYQDYGIDVAEQIARDAAT